MRLSSTTFENHALDFSRLRSLNISANLKIGAAGIENLRLLLRDQEKALLLSNLVKLFPLKFSKIKPKKPLLNTLEANQITNGEDIFTPLTKIFSEIQIQEIKSLKLVKNNVQDEHILDNIEEFGLFSHLERLNISQNKAISSKSVEKIAENLESLIELTAFGTGAKLEEIDEMFKRKIMLQ